MMLSNLTSEECAIVREDFALAFADAQEVCGCYGSISPTATVFTPAPSSFFPRCSVCFDGGEIGFPSNDAGGMTCAELERMLQTNPELCAEFPPEAGEELYEICGCNRGSLWEGEGEEEEQQTQNQNDGSDADADSGP